MRVETRIAEYIGGLVTRPSEHLTQARERAQEYLKTTRQHRMNQSRKELQLIDCGLLKAQA